jgi:hypothetical protein
VHTYVVRIWLPDRPGALGLVASRIGAVGGDVVSIEVLERGGGMAVDDLTVQLIDPSRLDLLVAEVRQVDGAAVEHLHRVDPERMEPGLMALSLAADVIALDLDQRLEAFADAARSLVEADWVTMTHGADIAPVAQRGAPPEPEWLQAFVHGSRHLGGAQIDLGDGLPGDLAWSRLATADIDVVCGRDGRVFHTRERQLLAALARLVDTAGVAVSGVGPVLRALDSA